MKGKVIKMAVYSAELTLTSYEGKATYHEITEIIKKHVEESGILNGICAVTSPHTTCSVIFEEHSYDTDYFGYDYLQVDLNNILENIIHEYKTNEINSYP